MEQPPLPPITINDEVFDVIKPSRLLAGMVLKSQEREAYARIGPKQSVLEEQIHTVSLYERGFPVAALLGSGTLGRDEWYFVEESLGDATFHEQFASDYERDGNVSDETFASYMTILDKYIQAQFSTANRSTISAREFVESAVPDTKVLANYELCEKNVDRYKLAITKATARLEHAAMGVLQFDLNPFNVLERGMIDFELVGYGPLGYDTLLISLWHRWFTSDASSRYHIAYYLSEDQIKAANTLVTDAASQVGVQNPSDFLQEFLLIKTAWGFTSSKSIVDEPESKLAFYKYRATLLEHCVESYLADEPIDPLVFPEIRSSDTNTTL